MRLANDNKIRANGRGHHRYIGHHVHLELSMRGPIKPYQKRQEAIVGQFERDISRGTGWHEIKSCQCLEVAEQDNYRMGQVDR